MGYRVKPFTMAVRDNSTQQFVDVGLLVPDVYDKVQNLHIYNVYDYGAAGDGETDDTLAVQSAIIAAEAGSGLVYVPEGTFLVDGVTISEFVCVLCVGTLKASSSCNSVVTINVPYFYQARTFSTWYKVCTMLLRIDGNDVAKIGIDAKQANHCVIGYGTVIYGVTDYGIKMASPNPECFIDGVYIEGSGNSCTGIVTGEDCEIRNVEMKDCHVAIESNKMCMINNIHAWCTRGFEGSKFLYHKGGYCLISDSYADTFNWVFYKEDSAGFLTADNIRVFSNPNFYDPANVYIFGDLGNGDCYAYSSITNLKADHVNFSNKNNILVGFDHVKFNDVDIPATINKIASITFPNQTGGEAGIWYNPLTKNTIVDIRITGDFSGDTTATSLPVIANREMFFSSLLGNPNLYTPVGTAMVYLATNGNIQIRPVTGITTYKAVSAHIEFYRYDHLAGSTGY